MRNSLRQLTIFGGCALAFAIAISLAVYRASQEVPEFYAQALIAEPAAAEVGSRQMLEQTTELVSEVREPGPWQATFTDEQVNGWLAVDLVNNHPDLLPPSMREPRVSIQPEGILLGCRWQSERFNAIVSIQIDAFLHEQNALALRLRGAKAGNVPLPLGKILDDLTAATGELDLEVRWLMQEGDPVALITLPPPDDDEDAEIVLDRVELRAGELLLAGKTVPRAPTEEPAAKRPDVAAQPSASSKIQR